MPFMSKRQAEEIPPHLECAICWKVRILIQLQDVSCSCSWTLCPYPVDTPFAGSPAECVPEFPFAGQGCLNQALGYRTVRDCQRLSLSAAFAPWPCFRNVCSVCRAPIPPGQAVNVLIRRRASSLPLSFMHLGSMISEQCPPLPTHQFLMPSRRYPLAHALRRKEQEEASGYSFGLDTLP